MTRETRALHNVEIRAEDDGKTVVLRAITPGVVDSYGSVWAPHCFDRSLEERMPTLCWAHDWSDPIGCARSYAASDDGPTITFALDDFDAVPSARRASAQIRSGTIRDCSVGFSVPEGGRRDPTDAERKRWSGVREVIERAGLDEVSLVLKGAVPGAKVLAVRSVRMAAGTVDGEFVVDLAKKVAAGEISHATAKAAIALAADDPSEDDEPDDDEEEAPELEPAVASGLDDEALAGEIDAALALVPE